MVCLHSIDSAVGTTHIDVSIRGFAYPGKTPSSEWHNIHLSIFYKTIYD
jgi:hypothetical protein